MNRVHTIFGSANRCPGLLLAVSILALFPADVGAENIIRVAAGESIADALEKAVAGTVIEVEPGVYHEALTIDTHGISLRGIVRGSERPVLDGRGELNDGVIASGSPFSMTGFRIQHYKGNGVTTQGSDGIFLSDLEIDDTGLYGLYPVQSTNITITHCTVTGISDAGIYVGESKLAVVAYNEVHHNVAGIEIENTNDAEVHDNLVYANTAGILVFVLPNKLQKEGFRTRVHHNWVVRNNTENFGDPNSIIGNMPHGVGMYVMGADDTVFEDNWVKDNHSVGIAVLRLPEESSAQDPELEPLTDRASIRFNYLSRNGLDPDPDVVATWGGGADLAWDGTGTGNCADLPDHVTRMGEALPSCLNRPASAESRPSAIAIATTGAVFDPASLEPGDTLVRIHGMRYTPRHVTVKKGGKVVWVNEDAVTHTVTSGVGTRRVDGPLDSPFLLRGETYSHTFAETGSHEYLCLPHADQAPMRGATVTVEE